MKRKKLGVLGAALVGVAAFAAGTMPSSAADDPEPIVVEPLTPRSVFTDDVSMQLRVKLDRRGTRVLNVKDPSRTMVARITVQPGAHFPWHTHPGPVIVNVTAGELIYVNADDCVARDYPAGTTFVDPGRGNVHTAYNRTDEVTVVMATFFEAPEAGPLTIPVDPPTNCVVAVGAAHSH